MAIREIVKEGNDCLRKVCRPVEKFDERLAILLDDMAKRCMKETAWGLQRLRWAYCAVWW